MKVKKLKNNSEWSMPNRTGIGVSISVLYAALLISLAIWRWTDITKLELNELGDFAAGAFGPMAILWLVLGYFQQGDDLKQNTDALRLQAEELANTVQQQKELVALGQKQLEREKERAREERIRLKAAARPKFTFKVLGGLYRVENSNVLEVEVKNIGAPCTHVRAVSSVSSAYVSVGLESSDNLVFKILIYVPADEIFEVLDFYMSYLDVAGNPGTQMATVNLDRQEDAEGYYASGEDDVRVRDELAARKSAAE